MGYVVVVFCILNVAALCGMGYLVFILITDVPTIVETAIQSEVKKQDDRIEKRQARAERPPEDAPETMRDGAMRVGQPFRR